MDFDEIFVDDNQITSARLVVGIPSWSEDAAIDVVAERAAAGLSSYFEQLDAVIVNVDSSAGETVRQSFLSANTGNIGKIYIRLNPQIKGKGLNTLYIFKKALSLGAQAAAIVEPDVTSIKPVWIRNLLEPVLQGSDLVTPLYMSHKYDALLTNLLVYPLVRCIWGRRIRQPLGGERAFSSNFMRILLSERSDPLVVDSNTDIDFWSTVLALRYNTRLCQAYLAEPKGRRRLSYDPVIFKHVTRMLFQALNDNMAWLDIKWSKPTAVYGLDLKGTEPPYSTSLNCEEIVRFLQTCWQPAREFLAGIKETSGLINDLDNQMPPMVDHARWSYFLLETFRAYQRRPEMLSKLLDALLPVFWARMLYFIKETENMNFRQVENFLEDQCLVFEKHKEIFLL